MIEACDALDIIRTKNRNNPEWINKGLYRLLYNPTLDLAPGTPDHHLVKDYWQEVSPFHHIDGAVPPSLILVGSQDPEVPVPTAQAFCAAVQKAGGHCEIALYEGQGHGFFHSRECRVIGRWIDTGIQN